MMLDQTIETEPSTADVKAAIRETRRRLADHVARTADHVHLIFTTPDSVETEAPVGGAVAGAIKTIAVAGRARRVWVAYFETMDHHPDVRIAFGEVTFEMTRYDLGGKVTDRDVEVAKKISSLYRARS
jgi:hypothetical protein